LGRPVTAALKCQGAQIFGLIGRIHSAAGRADFFGLSGHSRAAVSGRAVFGLTGRIRTAVSARAATFSFVIRSPPRRNVRARRNLFRLSDRILAAQQIFFGCPVASAQKFFLAAQFFLFLPSGLICAERFDFLWRIESLQYTFSESCVVLFQLLLFEESAFYCAVASEI
jgi:hypothetical protein